MKYPSRHKTKSKGGSLLFGLALSAVLFLLFTATAAVIASRLADPTRALVPTALAAFLASGGLSGFIMAKRDGEGSIRIPMLSAIGFLIILLLSSIIMNKGRLESISIVNFVGYTMTYLLFAMLGKRKKHRRHR